MSIRNIMLFDTYNGPMDPPLDIQVDDATEFDFNVGGAAEIQSCKMEFVSNVDAQCIGAGVFVDQRECKEIATTKLTYYNG